MGHSHVSHILILAASLHETHHRAKSEKVLSVVGTLAERDYIALKNINLVD